MKQREREERNEWMRGRNEERMSDGTGRKERMTGRTKRNDEVMAKEEK